MERLCNYCNITHPATSEYWNIVGGRYGCKVKKSQYNKVYANMEKSKERRKELGLREEIHEKNLISSRKRNRTFRGRFRTLKGNAFNRDLEVGITLEQYTTLVQGNNCTYCGGELEPAGSGIDRLDSSKGYVIDNITPCCRRCNVAKNGMSVMEFISWAKLVTERAESGVVS